MFSYFNKPVSVTVRSATIAFVAALVGGALLSIPVRGWTTESAWESSEQAEGAVHAAVTRMADEGLLAEGETFRVVEIRGEVGPHNSPWHITYTAIIEKTSG